MMKARQYNRRILNGEYKPNIYSIQESNRINRSQLKYFGAGLNEFEKNNAVSQMTGLLDTFKDAKEYGSILTVDQYDWDLLDRFVSNIEVIGQLSMYTVGLDDTAEELKQQIAQGKVLAQKYHVTTTNPPYMGSGNMPEKLANYAKKEYPLTKIDLFAMFIQRCHAFLSPIGYQAMITMHAWMFISSYGKFREELLATQTVQSLVHLGARAFEELSGEVVQTVAFIMTKKIHGYKAKCLRLVEEANSVAKETAFLGEHREYILNEEDLFKIPGVQFAYWAMPVVFDTFAEEKAAIEYADFKHGMSTSDNNRFLRLWFEVSSDSLKLDARSKDDTNCAKWYPYLKGGSFRRWYGNYYYVVNWQFDGKEIKEISNIKYPYLKGNLDFVLGGQKYFFTPGYTWSEMGSGSFGLRKFYEGCLFDVKGSSFFSHGEDIGDYLMGLLNSNVFAYYKSILCPSLDYHSGDVARMPVKISTEIQTEVLKLVRENVELARAC